MKTSEPVLVTQSVLAGLHAFFGGSAAVSAFVEGNAVLTAMFAFGNLAVAAAQMGVAFYVRGQVVPLEAVVERVTENDQVVAGPANDMLPSGAPVRVLGLPGVTPWDEVHGAAPDPEDLR